jgi:AraC-like DNA-binding protein
METEPTTLADVIRLISEVLRQHYGVDPEPLLEAVGIDAERAGISGSRVSRAAVMQLWQLAAVETRDASIGLVIGSKVRATTFYALGVAFMTSENLSDSLELLCRYYKIIATVPMDLRVVSNSKTSSLQIEYTNPDYPLPPIAFDSFIASIIGLCRIATTADFNPVEVRLSFGDNNRGGDYEAVFHAPVIFDAEKCALVFDRAMLEQPLPGRSDDMLQASDRVMDNYLAALNPDEAGSEVRRLLLSLLPTGQANQERVSRRMNMSRSTLQRRLRQENTSFKELLDSTRRTLALEYVKDQQYTLAYITFLLGFSDQSNFSRAFKRWTGVSPNAYREPAVGEGASVTN